MIKRLLGIAPQPTEDGAFSPSPVALRLATSSETDYERVNHRTPYGGKKKILMVCTEERNMTMANGEQFSTGNHPVEMLVPMLHLRDAGFEIDIFTPTGEAVKMEMWAMPEKDEDVMKIYADYKTRLENPRSLEKFVASALPGTAEYLAVFIPGGHGAMLGLPGNEDLGHLLHWAHTKDLFVLSICHGPAALLAAGKVTGEAGFLYDGYKMAVFPDSVDKQTPLIGYMPGHMPWKQGERLTSAGVTIVNKKADDTCHIDRKLITGASPEAANAFGKLAVRELLNAKA